MAGKDAWVWWMQQTNAAFWWVTVTRWACSVEGVVTLSVPFLMSLVTAGYEIEREAGMNSVALIGGLTS